MINCYLVSLLRDELDKEIAGGRIDKIQQPAKDIVLLTVRKNRENKKLLLSCAGGKARAHLTKIEYENPNEPPMFCMLLRKHINGALIASVQQPNEDRILFFRLNNMDELGRCSEEVLVIEMLGRSPNIILCDDSMHIIDCVHRNDFRNPGMIYRLPSKPDNIIFDKEQISGSVSAYLDDFYSKKEKEELYKSKAREVRTALNNSIKRTEKKLGARMQDLQKTAGREEIREKADLITANMYKIRKGDRYLRCEDWFNDNREVVIELDQLKTPQQYSAKLYKEYNKLKTAESYLSGLIQEAENQLEYLKSELALLQMAGTDAEIEAIRLELVRQGFLKQSSSKQKKEPKCAPLRFVSPNGLDILVGRNNSQNEELSLRTANRSDYWFHAKGFHGSHVILCCLGSAPADEDIEKAASLAAEYSEAKGNCFVDYCPVRNLKKPKGSFPGKVIYTDYNTLRIKPHE